MFRNFLIAIVGIFAILIQPVFADENSQSGRISLTGIGTIAGTPDMAVINSGVVTFGKSARIALDANTEAMNELFFLLEGAEIEQRDIQTSQFSIQPRYIYSDQRDENGYPLAPRISGYQVSNTLSVKVRELADLGSLLDMAVSVGANRINSISFAVNDPEPLLDDARRAAMADAIAKARLFADAAGVELGNIISISEGAQSPDPQFQMVARTEMDASSVPVAAGELSFSKSISVVWELDQD
ncbi:hypothetical protein MNBD_ALPHA11-508 [hydrothermal vent metagenome]|uniref:SIMPL domain-containing protein n=1 Tax=hydrothermal vent metagenome TaxID=652676 RepID=A0A3B0UIK8_9ZZZZ